MRSTAKERLLAEKLPGDLRREEYLAPLTPRVFIIRWSGAGDHLTERESPARRNGAVIGEPRILWSDLGELSH